MSWSGEKWNHFNAALLEAAFMTGMERNADVIHMATYAPPNTRKEAISRASFGLTPFSVNTLSASTTLAAT